MGRAVSNDRSAKCSATTFPIVHVETLSGSGITCWAGLLATVAAESATTVCIESLAGVPFSAGPLLQPAAIAATAIHIISFFIYLILQISFLL